MPWCESCSKFFNDSAVATEGTCPDCGRPLAPDASESDDLEDAPHAKIPWHFWVGVIAMTIYLGWRLVQGIIWLVT